MNILILSCGTRNKIVQYFKENLNGLGNVIAADCWKLAPALYEADKYYIVPRITSEDYLPQIIEICKTEKITAVLSLIDPELTILSNNQQKFSDLGCKVIVSSPKVIETCFDKRLMHRFCIDHNINTVPTYATYQDFHMDFLQGIISLPVFVKPANGSCSIEIQKIDNLTELEQLCSQNPQLIIQKYMCGVEYGVDAYIDLISHEIVSVFIKKKILMRAGETDKSISIRNSNLTQYIKKFIEYLNPLGPVDIDLFENEGEWYISEVNPRFGGGYPHAYECGENFPAFIINNLSGNINNPNIGTYAPNIYMMKYLDVCIR